MVDSNEDSKCRFKCEERFDLRNRTYIFTYEITRFIGCNRDLTIYDVNLKDDVL